MKNIRFLQILLIVCLLMTAFGCNSQGGQDEPIPQDMTPAERSELAMNNFVKKLQAGNYLITGGKSAAINAYSPEQVSFRYPHDIDPFAFVFMTLKGETFQTILYDSDSSITETEFISTENAIELNPEILPNGWITYTNGNMFEYFYNDPENPLDFTSNNETVKLSLLGMAGYSQFALRVMEDVHLVMDNDDPKVVHLKAVVNDDIVARINYDDIDLTLEFGAGTSDSRVEAWAKNPVYPTIRKGWTRDDIGELELVFYRGYGEQGMPFPQKTSHAMIFDPTAYKLYTCNMLLDHTWTEQDVEDYKDLLRSQGFTEAEGTLIGGSTGTVFRRLLREEYQAYSQLYPYYDDGLVLIGTVYHDSPLFEGQAAINEEIQKSGFAPMPETDIFGEWKAYNTAGAQSEGWAYYFDYKLYSAFVLNFEDREAAKAYLSSYADTLLKNGFKEGYTPGEDNRMVVSANEFVSFRYEFDDEEEKTVRLEFKNQKSLTIEEVNQLLKEYGLPDTEFHGDIGAREVTRYYYEIAAFEGLRVNVYQPFASMAEAEAYLDKYVPGLEEQGYYRFNPEKIGSQRQHVYFNEDIRKYVGFDIMPLENGAQIFFEIVSFESPLESILNQKLGLSR